MVEIKLIDAEAQLLRSVLELLVVSSYSGGIGILHGADRFVAAKSRPFSKPERKLLDDIARRLGMKGMCVRDRKRRVALTERRRLVAALH